MSNAEEKNDRWAGKKEEGLTNTSFTGLVDGLGGQIVPYKLLSVRGEDGCGMVHLAEWWMLVGRRVVRKIIKSGMDSKQVIARFDEN